MGNVAERGEVAVGRHEVAVAEGVDVVVPRQARKGTQLLGGHPQEVGDALRGKVHIEPRAQFWALGGDPHRALAGVAQPVLLAAGRNQRGRAHGDRVRAKRESLGEVGGHAQTSGDDEGDAPPARVGVEETPSAKQRVDGGHRCGGLDVLGRSRRRPGPSIERDEVGFGVQGHAQVGFDVPRGELDANGLAA